MTVIAIARSPKTNTAPKAFAFKGHNKELRTTALAGVASLAYAEAQSRTAVIARLAIVLGKKPSADELAAAQTEYVAGRVAQRMSAADFPKGDMSVADRIAFARSLVTQYAAPVKDGTKARKLRSGQLGRRTVAQHKAVRAAEETWSLVKAEIGFGAARTQAEKNKRSTKSNPVRGAKGAGVTHSELVKADGPMTQEAAREYLDGMGRTLEMFAKKHAKLLGIDRATACGAFNSAMLKAAKLEVSVTA